VAATGRLHSDAVDRSLDALGRMKTIADGFGVAELCAVATSAVREATNGRAFCREALRRHGLRVSVVTAGEDAQLALRSAQRMFKVAGRSLAVVDIGGGSMEVVLCAGTVVDEVHLMPLGAVRLTETYARSDPLRRKHWRRLKRAIDATLDEHLGRPPFYPEVIIGSGGTFTSLAGIVRAEREGSEGAVQGYALSRADVVRVLRRLRVAPLEVRREMTGMNPDRADIIVSGAAAVARLAKRLKSRVILVNEGGLRHGLLLRMIDERIGDVGAGRPRDRLESVRSFARKCRSSERHCEHVALLAGQLFDGLREPHGLPPEAGELLAAAALLHEVGQVIHHAKHHKHAYHLILHGDLQGYTGREVELIANVARYHRRAAPRKSHANFARLSKADRRLVRQLAGILRVAEGLDRTHTGRVRAVGCETGPGHIRLVLDAASDPRVEIWDVERKGGWVCDALKVDLTVAWTGAERSARGARAPRTPSAVAAD
jgi:exopolyphosphatase/guanosine-5'-triphosphate,3'-diphosphate pyrophosphatase